MSTDVSVELVLSLALHIELITAHEEWVRKVHLLVVAFGDVLIALLVARTTTV